MLVNDPRKTDMESWQKTRKHVRKPKFVQYQHLRIWQAEYVRIHCVIDIFDNWNQYQHHPLYIIASYI